MKKMILATAALMLTAGVAIADDAKTDSAKGPGTVGAMKNTTAPGVATDPQQVKQQQGKMSEKNSPGTVGAAPGAAH